CQQGDAKPITF
nr:immunoglobulin light chain junction region [Macaca mulatta]MOX48211.1 immunoglobulin light chain junction region [Macaca mulatta]MOX48307.1 immunoglobulin light chain junction region [Macaca mulatta]MOX48550.1 immunoglobulin light chain junction region [Macaca mulatta]MOX48618.1 immunoglobulin light chain junction region [Macaca mulatta]